MTRYSESEIPQSLVAVSHDQSILPTEIDALLQKIESLYDLREEKKQFARIFYKYAGFYFRLEGEQLWRFSPEELDTMANALVEKVRRSLRNETLVSLAIPLFGWLFLCVYVITDLVEFRKFKRLRGQLKEKFGREYVCSALAESRF